MGIFSYSSEVSSRTLDTQHSAFDQRPASRTVSSSEIDKGRFWVFFTDKGPQNDTGAVAHQLLPRTRARRHKSQGRAVDISDLPVFQSYVDELLQPGVILRVASRWLNGVTIEAPESVTQQILQLPFVRSVEPVITYKRRGFRPQEPRPGIGRLERSRQYYAPGDLHSVYGMSSAQIQQIHVNALHDRGYHGEGIVIALLDTGFDMSHEAFQNIHVIAEYDFVNGDEQTSDNPPEDDIGQDDHGTEVLAVIAGNSPGNLVGVAYAAGYLLAKTERVSHEGVMFEQEIEEDWWVAGLEWAELNGADVVSSSLGYSDWYSYSDMDGATAKTTIAADMAVEKGVVMVISAGNEGKSRNWPYISAPADGFNVIAVGAVNSMGEVANFSSIGPTYDGRTKPDVMAMGDDVYVVAPGTTDEYRKADGTSLATPLVAGTAALLLQAVPDLDGPKTLSKLLKFTASHALSPDNRYGWGMINAEAAFRYGTIPYLMEEFRDWEPVDAISNFSRVTIYPNPIRRDSSSGRLKIYSPEPVDSIRIYNLSGMLVYEQQGMRSAGYSVWDLKNQHGQEVVSGIYICVIKDSTGATTVKKIAIVE